MLHRAAAALLAACLAGSPASISYAAENQMGYRLLSAEQAATLPNGGGRLGLNVGRGQPINSGGIAFELLRVNSVTSGSPAARSNLKPGDQLIAVDGNVFPSVAAFASYVGSIRPAQAVAIDYMPAGGGPEDAQRIKVTLSGGNVPARGTSDQEQMTSSGLTTGQKLAIGVGAAALFGCYKAGCFSHRPAAVGTRR